MPSRCRSRAGPRRAEAGPVPATSPAGARTRPARGGRRGTTAEVVPHRFGGSELMLEARKLQNMPGRIPPLARGGRWGSGCRARSCTTTASPPWTSRARAAAAGPSASSRCPKKGERERDRRERESEIDESGRARSTRARERDRRERESEIDEARPPRRGLGTDASEGARASERAKERERGGQGGEG